MGFRLFCQAEYVFKLHKDSFFELFLRYNLFFGMITPDIDNKSGAVFYDYFT